MARRKASMFEPLEKISGVKKVIRCKSCGKKMEVDNLNRALCEDCGYRASRRKGFTANALEGQKIAKMGS